MRPPGSGAELERRRRRALALLDAKLKPAEVARRVGCSPSSVGRWRDLRECEGAEALAPKPVPGRPRKLMRRQEQQLLRLLAKGAEAAGFSSDLWTQQRVAALIEDRFGVGYHHDSIGRMLHRLGWSVQKPESRALERDEAAIREWRTHTWPRLKKKPRA